MGMYGLTYSLLSPLRVNYTFKSYMILFATKQNNTIHQSIDPGAQNYFPRGAKLHKNIAHLIQVAGLL